MTLPDAAPASLPGDFVPPLCRIEQRDTVRLIPSGRLKPPVLAPLAADEDALNDLAALESLSNVRLQAASAGLPDLDPSELVFGRPNDSFVNAAFTHVRPGGNRFNDDHRGAWYCSFDAETSLREVAWHLTRELDAIGRYENTTDYAEMLADFAAPFHDLRGPGASGAWLGEDIGPSYRAGQGLARRLRDDGGKGDAGPASNGLVYPSVRHPGGTCLVAFRPSLVQNLRQGGLWRLSWTGGRVPSISRPGGHTPETVCTPEPRRR
ncbi:RES family NAD+ phosphorylase [Acetobacteraceae bacterium KSS8]|uniref:RES family NAD+ phosphorylase n=1 Tax=Endosaccharibacter trunci TaxID=2812733 RepID=A0ABT1W760_9PROT|nr:RES family NAD+ phosphorylase [Acetobacteraceae bacterium KSS8]